eukprot:CAMPEP_0113894482 /NCGR_PEP_ID=MMETSP0780_2-20120614/16752_1 /TAXON_ID=652834 /ORGANISM="Palpitomonas bilix" /LENGTH=629 /DNA_ID=CAMNT_0000885047 /DNA_START=31 /DNA_END=1920 /DNA_ORIENTATION=- /assembly_acc=CAM_ASM_000599
MDVPRTMFVKALPVDISFSSSEEKGKASTADFSFFLPLPPTSDLDGTHDVCHVPIEAVSTFAEPVYENTAYVTSTVSEFVEGVKECAAFVAESELPAQGERVKRDEVQSLQLILDFLQKRGYKEAAAALMKEANIEGASAGVSEKWGTRCPLHRLLQPSLGEVVECIHTKEEVFKELSVGWEDEAVDESNKGKERDDLPIWEESESNIVMDDEGKRIKSGSFNKLVERLTFIASWDGSAYMRYLKTFLLTYRSFSTPAELFHKLKERFDQPSFGKAGQDEEEEREKKNQLQVRVCSVLSKWVDNNPEDFSEEMMNTVLQFVKAKLETNQAHDTSAKKLRAAIERMKKVAKEKVAKTYASPPPMPILPRDPSLLFSSHLSIFDINEEEIARQLTLIDFKIFSSIKPVELLNQAWNKPKLKHRAPNVLAMISRFNGVSNWVARAVVEKEKLKDRVQVLTKLVTIAEHLRGLNNFNAAMAVVAGLSNAAVHRLRHTFDDLPRKSADALKALKELLKSDGAYKGYRDALHTSNPPIVPYLGVYLTDLTFIEDGNPDNVGDLINFTKREYVFNVILEVQQYQQLGYNLLDIVQVRDLLLTFPSFELDTQKQFEDEMYAMSLKREPRGAEKSTLE